jgi:hypothetical protein
VDEIELSSLDTFAKAEQIARRHKLDFVGLASVGQCEAWPIQFLCSGVQNRPHHS